MRTKKYIIIVLVLLLASTYSCKKPKDPKAVVTVIGTNKDGVEVAQSGATVMILADPNTHDEYGNVGYVRPDLSDEEGLYFKKTTNSAGQVDFEFKYEAILKVYAYIVEKKDTIWGEGALILEKDKTYNETVYLRYHTLQQE
jgi:hypothetical protein